MPMLYVNSDCYSFTLLDYEEWNSKNQSWPNSNKREDQRKHRKNQSQ